MCRCVWRSGNFLKTEAKKSLSISAFTVLSATRLSPPFDNSFTFPLNLSLLLASLQNSFPFTPYAPQQLELQLGSVFPDTTSNCLSNVFILLLCCLSLFLLLVCFLFLPFNSLTAPCFATWAFCWNFWLYRKSNQPLIRIRGCFVSRSIFLLFLD